MTLPSRIPSPLSLPGNDKGASTIVDCRPNAGLPVRIAERLKALEKAVPGTSDRTTVLLDKLCHSLGVPGTRILGCMQVTKGDGGASPLGQRTLAGRLAAIGDSDILLLLRALGQHSKADRLDGWAVLTPGQHADDKAMSGDEEDLFKVIMEVVGARGDYCRGALQRSP